MQKNHTAQANELNCKVEKVPPTVQPVPFWSEKWSEKVPLASLSLPRCHQHALRPQHCFSLSHLLHSWLSQSPTSTHFGPPSTVLLEWFWLFQLGWCLTAVLAVRHVWPPIGAVSLVWQGESTTLLYCNYHSWFLHSDFFSCIVGKLWGPVQVQVTPFKLQFHCTPCSLFPTSTIPQPHHLPTPATLNLFPTPLVPSFYRSRHTHMMLPD